MNDINSTKRHRRTKENLEKDLFDAAHRVIEQVGFNGITVTLLMKEAKADPPVFYNRYKDINDFIDKFVRSYDYWMNDSVSIDYKKGNAIENIENIVINLVDLLFDNTCMQKLLAWEMNEDNFITRRTSQNRDHNSEPLIKYFEEEFKNCDINFNVATAVIIGGIYYLIIHRNLATFNRIDYSQKENLYLLKKNIRLIIRKIFEDYNNHQPIKSHNNIEDIVKKLLRNGVSIEVIECSTGLSAKTIMSLK